MLSGSADAFDLNPICHQYYDLFKTPNLTYEDVGKIADKMDEKRCWPAMQGLTDDRADPQATTGWDCASLANDITQQSPDVVRIFNVKPLDAKLCENVRGRVYSTTADHFRKLSGTGLYSACDSLEATTDQIAEHAASASGVAGTGPNRILNCIGTSYETGLEKRVYFFLDRFPDGQEHWGFIPL